MKKLRSLLLLSIIAFLASGCKVHVRDFIMIDGLYMCGPISVYHASIYQNPETPVTPNRVLKSGEKDLFWVISDIEDALNKWNIRYNKYIPTDDQNEYKQYLDDSNIIIINLDMRDIPYGERKNKPYITPVPWGHYLTIFGYSDIDKTFIIKDKENRFFRRYDIDHIVSAVFKYSNHILVIPK